MKKSIVKIGLVQSSASFDFDRNLSNAASQIRIAQGKGAQIVCLQELFAFRYFPQVKSRSNFSFANPNYTASIKRMFSKLARDLKVVIIAPYFEKAKQAKYFNSVFVIDADGKVLGTYRKMHIPYDPGFYEKYYFKNGNLGFKVFKTKYATISVLICWDQWFPEAARAVALKEAQILFYPTAIGWDVRRKDNEQLKELNAWVTIQKSHAIANGVFVAAANRTGRESHLKFWGNSFVADPFGDLIAKAGESEEKILIAACDLSKIKETRSDWPFLRDLRSDAY